MQKIFKRLFTVARVFDNPTEAIADIRSGTSIAVGGYMNVGFPENLIKALKAYGNYDFSLVTLGCSVEGYGVNSLISNRQVKRLVTPFLGSKDIQAQYHNGELELELVPGGTLAEKIRAAGAGIPGFWTSTGVGTIIEEGGFPIKYKRGGVGISIQAEGKEKRFFNGKEHLYEEAIRTEYSLVKAWKADPLGNLVYRKTAKNFNPEIAICSKVTIAEVEEIVPLGSLDPDEIDTPGIFVQRIVKGESYSKPLFVNEVVDDGGNREDNKRNEISQQIARRAAKELKNGMYVKVDSGIPSLVAEYLPDGVIVASASGIIGVSKERKVIDPDLIISSGSPAGLIDGAAVVSTNFMMDLVRGGHFDASIMGAFQVSANGDLANWYVPGIYVKGIGGSMDSVADKDQKIIITMHHTQDGRPKIVPECTLPLTGKRCVKLIITELGVFDFREDGLNLLELSPGVTLDHIRSKTGCGFTVSSDLKTSS
jgi:3-oxoacid CoA-transferase